MVVSDSIVTICWPVRVSQTAATDRLLADTAAAAVASHLRAEKLVFLSVTHGILLDRTDQGSLATSLTAGRCRELMTRGVIDAGMIPKVEACLDSLRMGVRKTHIIDGRIRHSLLLEIYTDRGIGTEIVLERESESSAAGSAAPA